MLLLITGCDSKDALKHIGLSEYNELKNKYNNLEIQNNRLSIENEELKRKISELESRGNSIRKSYFQ